MKSRTLARCCWTAAITVAAATASGAALTAGGAAYTKRFKTTLLAGPSPLAAPAGELAFGRKLTVDEVRGSWLRVSDGPLSGWIFAGNVAATKPVETKGLDGLPVAASQTTATAAARPLTPAADGYAARRNLTNAREELNWLLAQCGAITPEQVAAFLREHKKGEFQ